MFVDSSQLDDEGIEGSRSDNRNLIAEWLESKPEKSSYVWNRNQLFELDQDVDNLLGLFASDHMDYNLDRNPEGQPSLEEMTETAIRILSQSDEGYFLFVEGAKIDKAHHESKARKALDETLEFSKAIQKALDITNESETLIVVTADHSHTLSYAGYADRGHDIFEFGGFGNDAKPYTTLTYGNGPGYKQPDEDGQRHDLRKDDLSKS